MTHEGLLDGLSQYELPNGQVISTGTARKRSFFSRRFL